MSVIAVFIALGGTGYAIAKLPKNSIGAKQLKKISVTTAKLKNGAVTADKVKKGTLTGTQINVATLGTVPSAISAGSLGGLSADQIEQASKLHCPGGTKMVVGFCFETSARPPATFDEALNICAREGRSLPGLGELAAFLVTRPVTPPEESETWAGSEVYAGGVQLLRGDPVGRHQSCGQRRIWHPLWTQAVLLRDASYELSSPSFRCLSDTEGAT